MAYYAVSFTHNSVTFHVSGAYDEADAVKLRFYGRLYSTPGQELFHKDVTITSDKMTYTRTGLEPNTKYAITVYFLNSDDYGYAQVPFDVKLSNIGCTASGSYGCIFTTKEAQRPEDWEWWNDIYSDADVNIYASEWNSFCNRINEFREYTGLGEYSFTTVDSGDDIYAYICNQAWTAINGISGRGAMPNKAVSGGDLYASFFTGLRDALNSIP